MIVKELIMLLTEKNMKIATAESCTGGLIAQMITSVSGASAVFDCGVVAYSNEIKKSLLGVKAETLEKYGAVSEQTAFEMAQGVRILSNADIAVSVTGIAGPGGGSAEKPVGTVCIGVSTELKNITKSFHFDGDRDEVRKMTAEAALELVMYMLKNK
ncbi:MAG: hypothetical protein A2Y15_00200 [Clostridiales bacterium GWF2_36_10]|nr:MAG: hypothetical protein A2Y15_00200 [Clostridiales bacterium GWF2_36_10]HAN21789.1 damage-inducible protein CinA [Clostridiales bacterium]